MQDPTFIHTFPAPHGLQPISLTHNSLEALTQHALYPPPVPGTIQTFLASPHASIKIIPDGPGDVGDDLFIRCDILARVGNKYSNGDMFTVG